MVTDLQGHGRFARSGWTFPYVEIRNFGNGAVRVRDPVDGLVIRNVIAETGYRLLEVKSAPLRNLMMERVTATDLTRGLLRIGSTSDSGVIRAVAAVGTVVTRDSDLPCGFAFEGEAKNYLLDRVVARRFQMIRGPDKYWNGDGFSTELGNSNFVFRQCEAHDCTDGGFDVKSSATSFDDCTASGNARNFRFWTSVSATRLTSLSPILRGGGGHMAHLGVYGAAAGGVTEVGIDHLVARGQGTLFDVQKGPVRIVVGSHDVAGVSSLVTESAGGHAEIVWRSGAPKLDG